MGSASLRKWNADRADELDQLEAAHLAVGGAGPGRRYATQQVNRAYVVLLCSHFQGFCRDLHAEAADYLVESIQPERLRITVRTALTWKLALDRGNPTPDNLAGDLNRLGMALWPHLNAVDSRSERRKASLAELNRWRNAIAHHDFDPGKLGDRTTVTLRMVRRWRSACSALAGTLDHVVGVHISQTTGTAPW